VLSVKARAYYNGGSDDQHSQCDLDLRAFCKRLTVISFTALRDNASTFKKCRFIPRVMIDVSKIAPQTTLFGSESPLPIYISPASNALLGHPDGELTLVRGASATGVVQGSE
jgi:isopentenyl diphosphate isomerase/L-lactate dehydrogenase-like FMN-dependent dehydrogenase